MSGKQGKEVSMSTSQKILEIARTIAIYIVAIGVIIAALIFASDKSPQKSVFGFRYYTVLTPSMEPELSVGDVVIVKLANAEDINEGDVITFNPSSDSSAYLTHRVTQKLPDYEGSGITCFRTKGDANNVDDSFLIDSSRLIGVVSFDIPKIGYVIRFVQLRWYFVIPLIVMVFVFFHLLKTYFDMRQADENDNKKNDDTTADSDGGQPEI